MTDPPDTGRRTVRLDHQPALDGVRAISVILVVLFHAGIDVVGAGYLGVSVFFTLSGFLITSLLIVERRSTGRVSLGGFFSRRLRRLLPASLLCLAAVAVVRLAGGFELWRSPERDLITAALSVFNWQRVAEAGSYAAAFDAAPALASPLEHYWSLAIEEQFYLVWPFAVAALLAWAAARSRRAVPAVLGGVFVVSAVVAPVTAAAFGSAFAYWSTLTRLPELLAGAALAAVVTTWGVPRWCRHLAPVALVVIVGASMLLPTSSGPAYSGWMAVFALASVGLIAGLQPSSWTQRALSVAPLAWLGSISYGVYLYHWPVMLWVRQRGLDLGSPWVLLGTTAVVLGLALASFHLVEQPIRTRAARPGRVVTASAGAIAVAVGLFAIAPFAPGFLEFDDVSLDDAIEAAPASLPGLVVPTSSPVAESREAVAAGRYEPAPPRAVPPETGPSETGSPDDDAAPSPTTATEPSDPDRRRSAAVDGMLVDLRLPEAGARPARVLVVGDSTAVYLGRAWGEWALDHPAHAMAATRWCQGCGLIHDGTITSWDAERYVKESRRVYDDVLPASIAELQPDAVVMMNTVNDLTDREWTSDEGPLTPFGDRYRERMRRAYLRVADVLDGAGVGLVVWVKPPVPIWLAETTEMRETGRWDVLDDVLDDVVAAHPDRMIAVDADRWMHETGRADDDSFRPDGTHMTIESAYGLIDRWLAPVVLSHLLAVEPVPR